MAAATQGKKSRGLSNEQLEQRFPSLKVLSQPSGKAARAAWVAVFSDRPDIMADLLADLIKQVYAKPGRIGQRPMPREAEVDFHQLLYGETTDQPLTEALPKLMAQKGLAPGSLAERVGMSRTQVVRTITGRYDPDVKELRALAAALRKPASYFLEYRKAMAVSAFIDLLNTHPGLATRIYRQYLEVRIGD